MSAEPPPVPRIVKPRKLDHEHMPIIAVTQMDGVFVEETGELYPLEELPRIIATAPRSLVVAQNVGRYLHQLDRAFSDDPDWQFRISPVEYQTHGATGTTGTANRVVEQGAVIAFFGWTGKRKQRGRYHYPLDPTVFCRTAISDINESDTPELLKLVSWAKEVRLFCRENGLKLKPTSGGLAAQLLRHPDFYPEARRKVPKHINRRARKHLPGNYYNLFAERHRYHSGLYVDMENAHHYAARDLAFPDANNLHAHGNYGTDKLQPWAVKHSRRFDLAITRPGLFFVKLQVPHVPREFFPPPCMERQGVRDVWIYSNELPRIRELGGEIHCIYMAYISEDIERGLNAYAKWSLGQLNSKRYKRAWIKPLLHSVYGVLAVRPRALEFGFKRAKGGTPGKYVVGNRLIDVEVIKGRAEIESRTANVIQRGMIEAEIRLRVLALAQELESRGGRVLSIYADSLFVKLNQLPILPVPWRVKHRVYGLRFLSAVHFLSPQITRLPGVPRNLREKFLSRATAPPPHAIDLAGQSQRP